MHERTQLRNILNNLEAGLKNVLVWGSNCKLING
jgi:hypothetical protein